MKAIIMAGGEGSRLRPLTCTRPKPMVPVANKPIMEHIVELLKEHGFNEIGVTLQYLPQEIQDYFGDGAEFGVNMQYFLEETPLGTAGSVKNATNFLDETFLVISGDALTDIDLTKAISFHKEKKSLATIVLTKVNGPLEYGVVITDSDGRVKRFLEKPSWGEVFSDTVNTGIYILEPEVLDYIPFGQMFDFSKDVFPALLEDYKALYGYVAGGYWCDIGNLQQYLDAHKDVLERRVKVNLREREVQPGVWIGENVCLSPNAKIVPPVIIGDNCQVLKGSVLEDGVILGRNTLVDEKATLKRSLSWDNGYVGKKVELRGAVLCCQVQIRANSSVFEGAVIGDHTVIKERSMVKPQIKIWPHKIIEAATLVQSSLIWGNRSTRSLFGNNGVAGEVNTEITPEFATKLGAAYGSLFAEGSTITVSSDYNNACQMLARSFVSGLLSVGLKVKDLSSVLAPMVRYSVPLLKVEGGIYVKMSSSDENKVCIDFLSNNGANIPRGMERKIENAFLREDFRRNRGSEIYRATKLKNIANTYLRSLVSKARTEVFKEYPFRVLFYSPSSQVRLWTVNLLNELGCSVDLLEVPENQDFGVFWEWSHCLTQIMPSLKADLGVIIDNNAEKMLIIDEKGNIIKEELLTILLSLLILEKNEKKTVAVPLYAPQVIEELAHRFQGQVVRTKTSLASYMEQVLMLQEEKEPLDLFALYFDPLYSLLKIIEFLAEKKTTLGQLIEAVPSFYLSKKTVECSWEAKGKVMRTLIEERKGDNLDLVEGVKFSHQGGWTLILPDAEEPLCRIYSEGYSEEYADSLTELYLDKIRELQKTEVK